MGLKHFFGMDEAESHIVGEVRCQIMNKRTGEVKFTEVVPVYAWQLKKGSSLKHKMINLLKLWR